MKKALWLDEINIWLFFHQQMTSDCSKTLRIDCMRQYIAYIIQEVKTIYYKNNGNGFVLGKSIIKVQNNH